MVNSTMLEFCPHRLRDNLVRGLPFSSREDRILKKEYHKGKKMADIAKIIGRTKPSVIFRVRFLGLTRPKQYPKR